MAYASIWSLLVKDDIIKQKNNIQKFKDEYVAMFTKNWYENGAYFQGTWIEGDFQICGPIVSTMQALK